MITNSIFRIVSIFLIGFTILGMAIGIPQALKPENNLNLNSPQTDVVSAPSSTPVPAYRPVTAPNAMQPPAEPIPDQVVIKFAPDTSPEERATYVEALGGVVVESIDALDTVVVTVPEIVAEQPLPESKIVEVSEPDYYISALEYVPDDPRYAEQWALPAIGAPSAWAELPADAPKVTVAVIDSGVCAEHPDLAGRIEAGWDFLENDAAPQDDFGHGCSVAGIIAANTNDGIGMAGVAPNAQIMPLRVLNASGVGSYSDVAAAIVYAADNGAQVINLSLGGSNPSSTLENAVNYAISKSVIVVAAAGNNGTEGVLYPAAYPDVVAVGSVDPDLQHSSFSNYGSQIDIWAPGRDILTTRSDGNHGLVSGTSFSAPYVAGADAIAFVINQTIPTDGRQLNISFIEITTTQTSTVETPIISPTPEEYPQSLIINPKTTAPLSTSLTCWRDMSYDVVQPQPQYPPTPFFYAPFDVSWTGDFWSATMDHTKPNYKEDGILSSLGENLSTNLLTGWAWSPSLEIYFAYDGHDGNDFATTGNARAVASGEVVRKISLNKYLGNYIDVYYPEGYLTRYAHLASFATGIGVGSEVQAGTILGTIGTTGKSTGIHLHFSVYRWNTQRNEWEITDPFSWDPWLSPGQQISDPLYNCNGEISYNLWVGGWPQSVTGAPSSSALPTARNVGGWLGEDNNQLDTTSPTGSWSSPGNNSIISSSNVTLTVNANDTGGSGVREVRWSAKWGGNWYGIGTDNSSPYSMSWNMCNSGVPNGDVELGMEVWDNANNKWIYSEHYTNYHINKNYNCSQTSNDTTPPTGSWTSPNNNSTVNSSTVTLSVNASDNSGGSGVKEVRWSAKWNNQWFGIGEDSSAPYSINWNMCNSGVPNGDVELGMEVWDNANNKWIWSQHYTNYHINKNYTCGGNDGGGGTTPGGSWNMQAWMNKSLAGYVNYNATVTWDNGNWPYIYFNWGTDGPAFPDYPNHDNEFSVRLWRNVYFPGGNYEFKVDADDAIRVYVDNQLVVDRWWDGSGGGDGGRNISAGNHEVKVEYYENQGDAKLSVVWYGPGYPRPDNEPPDGRITFPAHLSATTNTTLNIAADAWDDASGVDHVEFTAWYCYQDICDWRYLGSDSTSPYTYDWNWGYLPDLHVWLNLDVVDKTGKRRSSSAGWVEVDLDRIKPTAGITSPTANSYLNTNSIPINVSASDSRSGVWKVQFFAGYNETTGAGAQTEIAPPLPFTPDELQNAISSEVTAQDYWHEIGWDTDASNGWSFNWNTISVPDQGGAAIFIYVYDKAGNYQGVQVSPIMLDRQAPTSTINALPIYTGTTSFNVSWGGTDTVSGIASYDIQYQDNGGGWTTWKSATTATSATFSGVLNHTYTFQSRARDRAGNVEGWPVSADAQTTLVTAPANDSFGAAINIASVPYTHSLDTRGATTAANDPSPTCGLGKNSNSVWYKYTAPANGVLEIDTLGSNFDTVLAVWRGSEGNLTLVNCIDDNYGYPQAWLERMPVATGVTYYIEVMDYGNPGGGNLKLRVDFALPVANDDFNAPIVINTLSSSYTQDTRGASRANDDPALINCNRLPGQASVWYRFTPPVDGNLLLDTKGSNYDTMLAVWTGSRGNLVPMSCNDDIGYVIDGAWSPMVSELDVPVIGGVTYYIEASTYFGYIDSNGASATELEKPGNIQPDNKDNSASSLQNQKTDIDENGGLIAGQKDEQSEDIAAQFWGGQLKLNIKMTGPNVLDIDVFIGASPAPVGSYVVARGSNVQQNYEGIFGGPLVVESTTGAPIVAGLRDLWTDDKGSQSSYTQIFGMPTSLLSNKYVFPTYSNVVLNEQLRIANVGTEATDVTVTIGGQVQGNPITLQPNQQYVVNYPGLFGGPVIVEGSKPNVPIIAGLRDLWTDDKGNRTSYSQIFGMPVHLLSHKYVFPTYSNVVLNEQLRIANVGNEATDVTVTIGGQVQGVPVTIQPNQQYVVNYPGLFGGPVIVEGSNPDVPIIAGMRDLWTDDTGNRTSYTQIFGIPTSLLSNKYAFPSYSNIGLNEQFRIANVGNEATDVTITIGGQIQGDPITIQPNQQYVVNYSGLSGGPVVVEGSNPDVPIIAGLRDIWTNSAGNRTSYAQIFGVPASLWSDFYVFPTYSNIVLNEQLRIGVP
ncbi:MAG: S8 family serine peptidase [Anaerolineae bacterium]|nr:S8 family serine peptidase [Anaerolineae bacterium]